MKINKYLAKLLVGVRVKPSLEAIKSFPGLRKPNSHGEIVGISRDSSCIRVLKDGRKSVYNYWPGFWVKEQL